MVRDIPTIVIQAVPADAEIAQLINEVRGPVRRPGDPGYDAARVVRNGLIDRKPALIVECRDTADVVTAVTFARRHAMTLSVRGGGHNVTGNAVNDGGMVIDLSAMRAAHGDPQAGTVLVQGGATWADLDRETQRHGMAVPGGVVSSTGIGGLTLHGGLGHLRRKHGLSIDNLRSAEIVTADGQVRRASETDHADLYWAVRGAGSNFGVVTWFEFRMHRVGPEVALCGTAYAAADAPRVVRAWRDYVATVTDEVSSVLLAWAIPDHEAFPAELRRQPVILAAAVYAGDAAEGMQAMQPVRELAGATPLLDLSQTEAYTAIQCSFDPFFPVGDLYYWKSCYIDDLSDAAIDTLLACYTVRPSWRSDIVLWHLGGAIGRVASTDTAFGRRSAPFLMTAESTWTDRAANDANIAWSRETVATLEPWSQGGLYLNFAGLGEDKEALARAAYGPNYDRLAAIKAQYDPTNLFHMNINIAPAT